MNIIKQQSRNSWLRRGYSLVEMLIVIAIIAVLLGLSAAGMRSMADGNNTREAIGALKSSFKEAQKLAEGRGLPVRVVIHADDSEAGNAEDIGRYLRFVALAMREDPTIPNSPWVIVTKGLTLPKGAYLDVEKSLQDKDGTIITTHKDDDGNPLETGLVDVKLDATTTRKCFFYEFNGMGLLSNPEHAALTGGHTGIWADMKQNKNHTGWGTKAPRVIVTEGKLRRTGVHKVEFKAKDDSTNARTYRGFYILRSGITTNIEDLNHIETP